MPPNFQSLMSDSLPSENSEAKRKSAEQDEDKEKRHKHEQTQQQNDFQMQLLQTLVATVEQMKQSQAQTMAVMGEMLSRMQPANNMGPPLPTASAATDTNAIVDAVKAVAEAATVSKPSQSNKVPEEIKQCITRYMKKASDKVQKTIRASKRLDLAKADLETMNESGRYPPGTRPFKSQAGLPELDEMLAECASEDFTFAVTVPQGSSRREALAIMHHALTRETKRINTTALAERVDKEKAMVKRSQILEECQAVVEKQLQVDKLGLDDPVQQSNAEEAIQSFMEGEYGKMIQEIRKKEQRTKEAAEKKKAAEEKEKLKILQSHPSTLMKNALESIVDAKFKEVQREGIEEQMEEETDVTYELERACEALQTKGPKNRQAPAGGKGTRQKPSKTTWSASNPQSWQWNNRNPWEPAPDSGKRISGGYYGGKSRGRHSQSSWTRSWTLCPWMICGGCITLMQ